MTIDYEKFQQQLLDQYILSQTEREWIENELLILRIEFDNPHWYSDPDALHTQKQVGFLAGLMDLEREERLEVGSLLVGHPLIWNFEDFPGVVEEDDMDTPEEYPGPSLKDIRITRWMMSRLINYYKTGNGHDLNRILGYQSATAKRNQKRAEREAAKQAKANAARQNQPSLLGD